MWCESRAKQCCRSAEIESQGQGHFMLSRFHAAFSRPSSRDLSKLRQSHAEAICVGCRWEAEYQARRHQQLALQNWKEEFAAVQALCKLCGTLPDVGFRQTDFVQLLSNEAPVAAGCLHGLFAVFRSLVRPSRRTAPQKS